MLTRWLFVSAGELSGDRMAAAVVRELRRRQPELQCFGTGGPALQRAGVELCGEMRLAVTGLTEATSQLPVALWQLGRLARAILRQRPCLALLVDHPGFNLRLADLLQLLGVPVLYYGAPQRWAWMAWRTPALRRKVDQLAVVLPFEQDWFRQRGVPATFVGHPLVDLFRPLPAKSAALRLGLAPGTPVLALLPGSRQNELQRLLPPMVAAARQLPGLEPVLVTPGGEHQRACHLLAPGLRAGDAAAVLGCATVALCASGSATLELCLAGVPGVVAYRVSPLTHAVGRRLVRVSWLGLPNLLLGRTVFPELIQGDCTPERLATEVRGLLEPGRDGPLRDDMARVCQLLGPAGVAGRVADLAQTLLAAG